jgi:hypothetical protein
VASGSIVNDDTMESSAEDRVLSVLLHLEVQFQRLENGHRASVRVCMKQTVITTWTD